MASIGHLAAGVVAARVHPRTGSLIHLVCALSLAPDLDVIGLHVGVPYRATWGHRGATHSLAMAVAAAALVTVVIRRRYPPRTFLPLAATVMASHGLLDALTDGGYGVALLWPWTTKRFFFPWRPIPVAPLGAGLLSMRGLRVALWEAVAFTPAWVFALWPRNHEHGTSSRREKWRILASGAACGLLALGVFDLSTSTPVAVSWAAPSSVAAGGAASALLSRVRRHRLLAAPLIGLGATAIAFSLTWGLDGLLNGPRGREVQWQDAPIGLLVGLYGFCLCCVLTVPVGVGGGYLLERMVRRPGSAAMKKHA